MKLRHVTNNCIGKHQFRTFNINRTSEPVGVTSPRGNGGPAGNKATIDTIIATKATIAALRNVME
jgi:hypothetical protein